MQIALLPLIEAYLTDSGVSAQNFGWFACKNKRLVPYLREGRDVTTRTDAKVRAYIAERRRAMKREAA